MISLSAKATPQGVVLGSELQGREKKGQGTWQIITGVTETGLHLTETPVFVSLG